MRAVTGRRVTGRRVLSGFSPCGREQLDWVELCPPAPGSGTFFVNRVLQMESGLGEVILDADGP